MEISMRLEKSAYTSPVNIVLFAKYDSYLWQLNIYLLNNPQPKMLRILSDISYRLWIPLPSRVWKCLVSLFGRKGINLNNLPEWFYKHLNAFKSKHMQGLFTGWLVRWTVTACIYTCVYACLSWVVWLLHLIIIFHIIGSRVRTRSPSTSTMFNSL